MCSAIQDNTVKVVYQTITTLDDTKDLLAELMADGRILACDFETASIFTDKDKELMKEELEELNPKTNPIRYRELRSMIASSALTYPKYTKITHLSIAWSPITSAVIVFKTPEIEKFVLNWLVGIRNKQLWHNFSYDGRLIHYFTGKYPKNFEDTQILAKTILNHVETWKANTGLKELAGTRYGDWGISADNFTLDNLEDPQLIRYAAIDSAATYWLWESMHNYIKQNEE